MKVLIVHNMYRSTAPSGENSVVQAEVDLLREANISVDTMFLSSDSIGNDIGGRVKHAVSPIWSRTSVTHFKRIVRASKPDVVHVHNVFPLISPGVVLSARQLDIPVVHTVHNYRHTCVNGLHFRNGAACTDCLGRPSSFPAIQHGCYRNSRLETVPMVASQIVHRGTWRDNVSKFIALTPFMADMLVKSGVTPSKIIIRPSWVPDPGKVQAIGTDVLFLGRLDTSKGVELLLRAWRMNPTPGTQRLHFVGDGPLARAVQEAAHRDPSIQYSGRLDRTGVTRSILRARVVALPSLWFEGYPLAIVEAFSLGRPVLVVDAGSMASVVNSEVGWTVAPTVDSLAATLANIDHRTASTKGSAARAKYEQESSPTAALASLIEIYRSAIASS